MNEQMVAWLRATGPTASDLPRTAAAWKKLGEAFCRAGLAGFALEAASRRRIHLPSPVADMFREHATITAAENLNALHTLEGVVLAFNRADVPVMLLKGAALNRTLYSRLDLRPMSDVDLLVRPETARRAMRLLEAHGCRRGADLMREDFFPKYHYEVEYMTDSPRPVRIDLHARPFRSLRLARTVPDDALWEDARAVRVGEAEALLPCPELMFIHLAAHAAYHGCARPPVGGLRLLWLYDLVRFVDAYTDELDWSRVTDRARAWRLALPVREAIDRASALWGAVAPSSVLSELADERPTWRDRLAYAQAPRDAESPISHVAVNLLCTPGVRFRLGYLTALLLPGREHLGQVYRYRHPGWPLCAHLWRTLRAMGRAILEPAKGLLSYHAASRG